MSAAAATFPTITPDVCRRYIATGRAQRNAISAQILARHAGQIHTAKTHDAELAACAPRVPVNAAVPCGH